MKYLRRFLWYIAKRLLGLTLLVGVLVIAFYMAMNTANITILLKDGMAMRAEVVMMEENPEQLSKYFEDNFLQVDTVLNIGLSGQLPVQRLQHHRHRPPADGGVALVLAVGRHDAGQFC